MPHAENIEELLTRRPGGVSERYRSELEEAYRREGRTESFENFRDGGSTEWSLWRENQVEMLRADDVLRLDDMRFRLKLVADLNSPPADFPPPGNPMFGERLAAFGGGAISEEFTKKAGIPSDESLAARWGRLIEQARLDVQR
jgi:hypothetical protein